MSCYYEKKGIMCVVGVLLIHPHYFSFKAPGACCKGFHGIEIRQYQRFTVRTPKTTNPTSPRSMSYCHSYLEPAPRYDRHIFLSTYVEDEQG